MERLALAPASRRKLHDFLSLADVSEPVLSSLLDAAASFKARRRPSSDLLRGRHGVIMFERPSLRTRLAFEVALRELGASHTALPFDSLERGEMRREATADIARVVARLVDVAIVRTRSHQTMLEFASFADIPVVNGRTDIEHPCQVLGDLLAIRDRFGHLSGINVAFVGAAGQVANSLALARVGIRVRLAAPPGFGLPDSILLAAQNRSADIRVFRDARAAVQDADVIYTGVWSIDDQIGRIHGSQALRPFQVNDALLAAAPSHAVVMHEMPAHRGHEITGEVLDGPRCLVNRQDENRLHAAKAVLCFVLGVDTS